MMTAVQTKLGYIEQTRWPGTGSSPKTSGSQSVNLCNTNSGGGGGCRNSMKSYVFCECHLLMRLNLRMIINLHVTEQ